MAVQVLMGARLRAARLRAGLRQADVADRAGISASYLNLIEHDRRRVSAAVLPALAAALGLEVEALAPGAGGTLADELRAAAQSLGPGTADPAPELERVEDFLHRFPGWAGALAALHRRQGQLERAVASLSDRIAHDPHLSVVLHEMISVVSAVRATAGILAESEALDPEWRARFHANLHQDSERLAHGAEALVAYLDGSGPATAQALVSPQEELDAWLAEAGWHLPELEPGGAGLAALVARAEVALSGMAARALARTYLERAAAEARLLPAARLSAALAAAAGDPAVAAAALGVDVIAVMRRMAVLPGSAAGLVTCDASGTLTFRKPVAGFSPPRLGAACALWPLFAALARPGAAVEAWVETTGRGGGRFLARAAAAVRLPGGYGGPELREAAMLMIPETALPQVGVAPMRSIAWHRVGAACRICPEPACPARSEPSILSEAG